MAGGTGQSATLIKGRRSAPRCPILQSIPPHGSNQQHNASTQHQKPSLFAPKSPLTCTSSPLVSCRVEEEEGGGGIMKRFREEGEMDSVSLANVLVLLSRGSGSGNEGEHGVQHPGRVFECKTCNRQFPSFQALGGHRASHKKPRLMGDQQGQAQPAALAKPRVHECSICGLEFAIGQALGGHMRRHRATTEGFPLAQLMERKPGGGGDGEKRPGVLCLDFDLNLPPADNDMDVRALDFSLGPPVVCLH